MYKKLHREIKLKVENQTVLVKIFEKNRDLETNSKKLISYRYYSYEINSRESLNNDTISKLEIFMDIFIETMVETIRQEMKETMEDIITKLTDLTNPNN